MRSSDGIRCISAGMIAPVISCVTNLLEPYMTPSLYAAPTSGVQHEDFPGGHPSLYCTRPSTLNCGVQMGSSALVLECNTRTSKQVTHPSTTLAQARLTTEF
ncbi:hypothetical protein V6N12_046591 [Hibiscus sabdariffa]|uniref:Uncharacterized protein n=1 Tax=Hibiscus sabdariffa TaxID=183260 RepID=A0ABR2DLZ2_9ROSI